VLVILLKAEISGSWYSLTIAYPVSSINLICEHAALRVFYVGFCACLFLLP